MNENYSKFIDGSCRDFVKVLAGKDPVPGGGGASALTGAVGMALGSMVGSLTLGKKKYANVEEDIKELMVGAEELQERLLCLVERDAQVFAPLAAAYAMPKETPEEAAARETVMEAALVYAARVPMDIMRACGEALEITLGFSEKGSRLVLSDAGCSAAILGGALKAASLNVFINTGSMKDREAAEKLESEAAELLERYTKLADEIFLGVKERI